MSTFSCIIPTHGRADFLQESIASVVAQAGSPRLEVIVVDDIGSPATRQVVDEWREASPEVAFVYSSREGERPGASASRNRGAQVATGDVLAFLDDDDLWEPSHLANAERLLEGSSHDLVLSWMKVIERDDTVSDHYSIQPGLEARDVISHNRGITGSNIVIRRSAFSTVGGFDEDLPVSNDKDFLVQFLIRGLSYAVSTERTVFHRRHDGDQLTRWDEKRAQGLERYKLKYTDIASRADKRFLARQIHSIRSKTHASRSGRLLHGASMILHSEPGDVLHRARVRLRKRST
jgi:glycosyltransferase involved in cell wall biosynthesis